MTNIGLITLLRQATNAARQGDANAFADIRASIETLDRLGEIPREELDLLQITAATRIGDTEQAFTIARRFGSISSSQQQELFDGLNACPEMEHARFREFVMQLRMTTRVTKARTSFLRSRTLSIFLGALTILLAGSVVVLIEFVLPKSAPINTRNILTSVSDADFKLLAHSLPISWQTALENAALRIANSPADPTADSSALQKSFRNLQAALLAARASPQAKNICNALVGASEDTEILARLAAGVADISKCDLMNVLTWKERVPWKCNLSADAILVWRTVLAHAPIAHWSDRLFDENLRILPLESSVYFVSETSAQLPKTLVQAQCRDISWQLTCMQVDGVWIPVDWSHDWAKVEPWITGKNSPAYPLSQLETTLADRINCVASWLTRSASAASMTLPTDKEVPWWNTR